MLASWDVVQVGGLIADLVLWPCVSMVSLVVRLNPGEAIRDLMSTFRSWKSVLDLSHNETNGFTLSSSLSFL
jgi:hypothetical protein